MKIGLLLNQLEEKNINLYLENGELKVDSPRGALDTVLLNELKSSKNELIKLLRNYNIEFSGPQRGEESNLDSGFTPYKTYWMNCVLNTTFSLLSSIDSSYARAPLLNEYTYNIAKEKDYVSYFGLETEIVYGDSFYDYYKKMAQWGTHYYFKPDEDKIAVIKKWLAQKKVFSLCVRLNHWTNSGLAHLPDRYRHYSFISGYNAQRKMFSVFDDSIDGYDQFEITEEKLRESLEGIESWSSGGHAFMVQLPERLEPFLLDYNEIRRNALKICDNITTLEREELFSFDFKDEKYTPFITFVMGHITGIINRQMANRELFIFLSARGEISAKREKKLGDFLNKIINRWQEIVSKIRDEQLNPQGGAFSRELSDYIFATLDLESDMWRFFLAPENELLLNSG